MRRDIEGPIHRSILAYLRVALPHALIHHSPNETDMRGPAAIRMVVKARSLGTRKGWPDLEVHLRYGTALYFEVKAPGNYADDEQNAVGAALEDLGNHWAVVRSVEDVRDCLDEWGVKTREVV